MRSMCVVIIALGLCTPACVAGSLPPTVQVGDKTLVLNGEGVRKKLIIRVYAGGLYLPAKESSAEQILASDTPRRMVMHFLYNVTKSQVAEAWMEGLKANTPNASSEVKSAFATLAGWMENVKKGGEIVLTYVPGEGTHVEVNGRAKGTLPGKATADAILATWIGPKPGPGNDFKKAVLGIK
ncbi:MAG: chalcone isomerase family protein [Armatimonadota bacterium]|nr:chalcone isomerase family protein [Armatimonadota bacterium]